MFLLISSWIIFGALAGWITALTIRSEDGSRIGLTMSVGIVGALLGGFVLKSMNMMYTGFGGFNLASLVTAVVGSVLMIIILRGFNRV